MQYTEINENDIKHNFVDINNSGFNVHPVHIESGKRYVLQTGLKNDGYNQDSSVKFWFSTEPLGESFPKLFSNLNVISLNRFPTEVFVYSSDYEGERDSDSYSIEVPPNTDWYLNFHNHMGRPAIYVFVFGEPEQFEHYQTC